MVSFLVAPCQIPCLLPRTSLWPTMAGPRSMGNSRSPPWSAAPRQTGGQGLDGGRPRFLGRSVGGVNTSGWSFGMGGARFLNRHVGRTTWTRGWNRDGQGEDNIVVWSQNQQMAGPAGNTRVRARWAGGRGQVGHEEKGRSPRMVGPRCTAG